MSIEVTIGLATANTLSNHEKAGMIAGDVLTLIEIRPSDEGTGR